MSACNANAFQGKSDVTPIKVLGVKGILEMRQNQVKNLGRVSKQIIVDCFCGDGENDLGITVCDGTPIAALSAYEKVSRGPTPCKPTGFVFNDIRHDAVSKLRAVVEDRFPHLSRGVQYFNVPAAELIEGLHTMMREDQKTRWVFIVDPNGPKDFPYHQLYNLANDPWVTKQVDIIFNMPVSSLKRCYIQAQRANFGWMTDVKRNEVSVSTLLSGLTGGRQTWIRKPIAGDVFQWCVMAAFGDNPPRNNWLNQGYVELNSEEGIQALTDYARFRRAEKRQLLLSNEETQYMFGGI